MNDTAASPVLGGGEVMHDDDLCMSRGPRIGSDGVPYCKIPKWIYHVVHRPAPRDGWSGDVYWRDHSTLDITESPT